MYDILERLWVAALHRGKACVVTAFVLPLANGHHLERQWPDSHLRKVANRTGRGERVVARHFRAPESATVERGALAVAAIEQVPL